MHSPLIDAQNHEKPRTERLFYAIKPSPNIQIEIGSLVPSTLYYKPTPDPNIHLTLKFLGDKSLTLSETLKEILKNTAESTPVFNLIGIKISIINSMVWLEFMTNPTLMTLNKTLTESLKAHHINFPNDYPVFRPHIKLGKITLKQSMQAFPVEIEIPVETIGLEKSLLRPEARAHPIYETLVSYPLLAQPARAT